jgi:hypothetical protein
LLKGSKGLQGDKKAQLQETAIQSHTEAIFQSGRHEMYRLPIFIKELSGSYNFNTCH